MRKFSAVVLCLLLILGIWCSTPASADGAVEFTLEYEGYTLVYRDPTGALQNQETIDLLKEAFQVAYPAMAAKYNPNADREVHLLIDADYEGVAYTVAGNGYMQVVFDPDWLLNNPKDTDSFTHELMHCVQAYDTYTPVWLIEGEADYARYRYGLHNEDANWSLPDYASEQSYEDKYRVTARFLVWVEEHVFPDLMLYLHHLLAVDQYTDDAWELYTGYTVDALWEMYAANPTLTAPSGAAAGNDLGSLVLTGQVTYTTAEGTKTAQDAEGPGNLFDGNVKTKLGLAVTAQDREAVLYLPMQEAVTLQSYTFASANDFTDRDPKSWRLEGSLDGEIWTVLDTVTDYAFPAARSAYLPDSFLVDDPDAYSHYRFVFTDWRGDGSLYSQFSELLLSSADLTLPGDAQAVADCTAAIGALDGLERTWESLDRLANVLDQYLALSRFDQTFVENRETLLAQLAQYGEYGIQLLHPALQTLEETRLTAGDSLIPYIDQSGVTFTSAEAIKGPNDPEGTSNLFDGNLATKLGVNIPEDNRTAVLYLPLTQSVTLTWYTFGTANDIIERDPRSWTVEGSNDGETWTVIDTVYHDTFNRSRSAYLSRDFQVDAPGAYSYYRFVFTDWRGLGGVYGQFSELVLSAGTLPEPPLPGDLNGDGQLSVTDVVLLRKAILTGDAAQLESGDLNSDGQLSVTDVVLLRKAILNP